MQENNKSAFERGVGIDIVICIDATRSMRPFSDELKKGILKSCDGLLFTKKIRGIEQLRIKVIPFRDFKYNGDDSIAQSKFFSLPEERDDLDTYLKKIQFLYGGDKPENAYEAIAVAMKSDWTREGRWRRHVIFMLTDAPALPLMDPERVINPTYPENMPKDFKELGEMWEGVADQTLGGMPDQSAKRLVILAPNVESWNKFEGWEYVFPDLHSQGQGISALDIEIAAELIFI